MVVPIASSPHCLSSRRSSSKCHGKMTCARSLMMRLSPTFTPSFSSVSISSSRAAGFSTTPVAITHCTSGRKMPLGISESLYDFPLRTTVCPAFCPALVSNDDFVFFGEQIDDLAFSFVAPLQPDHACYWHRKALDWLKNDVFSSENSKHTNLSRVKGVGQVARKEGCNTRSWRYFV